jgi:hypothetical protein
MHQVHQAIIVPATWPYVNDFLDVRQVVNAPGFSAPTIWLSKGGPPSRRAAGPPSRAVHPRGRGQSRGPAVRAPQLEVYYRLTVSLLARLTVAVNRLAERKGVTDPGVERSRVILADLRTFLVTCSDIPVTDRGIDYAITLAASDQLPPLELPLATRDEVQGIEAAGRLTAGSGVSKWRESWGRADEGEGN